MRNARHYRSDDRDLPGCDNELRVFQGENGDWYVSIVKRGERLGPAVRLTTSGIPRGCDDVPLAMLRLYEALPPGTEELPDPRDGRPIVQRYCPTCGGSGVVDLRLGEKAQAYGPCPRCRPMGKR